MSWPCRLVDAPKKGAGWDSIKVGDMWFIDDVGGAHQLAPEHAAQPRQLIVCLPGLCYFSVYGPSWDALGPGPAGWKVEGAPPALTITPSINIKGVYHGYVTAGVITDDCEGRLFNAEGRRAQP